MESSVDQRLSLLLDGEASEFETRRLVEDISKNPHIKKRWLETVSYTHLTLPTR